MAKDTFGTERQYVCYDMLICHERCLQNMDTLIHVQRVQRVSLGVCGIKRRQETVHLGAVLCEYKSNRCDDNGKTEDKTCEITSQSAKERTLTSDVAV